MSKRESKSGGKYGGRHTSLISLASDVCNMLEKIESVHKISPGIITTRVTNVSGKTRIKIMAETGSMLLRVRDNGALQELRVYGDLDSVTVKIEHFCQKNNVGLVYS